MPWGWAAAFSKCLCWVEGVLTQDLVQSFSIAQGMLTSKRSEQEHMDTTEAGERTEQPVEMVGGHIWR